MEEIKKFFKQIKWYEWLYMSVFISAIVILSIVFKSGWLIALNSLFGILTLFFVAKGKILGIIIGIIQCVMYIVICFYNRLYGEVIISCLISIPIMIAILVSWIRNLGVRDKIVKVNKSISPLEWVVSTLSVALISFALYFLLEYFNTANLIISTLSIFFGVMSDYLMVRRCEYGFVFEILCNVIKMCLWIFLVVQNNDLSYITTISQYLMYLSLNIVGMINWIRMKRRQNLSVDSQVIESKNCESNI